MRCVIVVGYSTLTMVKGAMCSGASFKTIAKEGMRLSEIVPTGYDVPSYWCGNKNTGFKNQITISVIDDSGAIATDKDGKVRSFKFTRAGKSSKWTEEGYWHRDGETEKITADYDEIFNVGEGLWVAVAADAYKQTGATEDTFKLMFNGEALLDASNITLRKGSLVVMPPLSADVKLSKIIPDGYDVPAYWCGNKNTGFKNQITISILDPNGAVAKDENGKVRQFKFTRAGKSSKWTEEGYWHRDGETEKITEDYDETFKMGEGLWVAVGADAYKQTGATADTFKLKFPGIDDTYATEE